MHQLQYKELSYLQKNCDALVVSGLIWAMIFFELVINKWWMITGTGNNKGLIMNLDCRISFYG